MSEKRIETEQPTVKRADALESGDHVIEVAEYGKPPQPLKVLFAHPFRDGDGKPLVALMLDAPTKIDGFSPVDLRVPVDARFEMADEQDLAAYRDGARRIEVAKALHQLADDIVGSWPPLSSYLSFSGVLDSVADVEAWARVLDGTMVSTTGYPVVDVDRGPLRIHVQGPKLPQPEPVEPEQEWLFTFGSGQQHDGRFVRIVGTYDSARARMVEAFGTVWCAQYDWRRFDEEALQAHLTELPEAEWPR